VTEQVGAVAMRVWDALAESYRQKLGPLTANEIMRASDLSRAEIMFGLRELAAGGWIARTAVERHHLTAEAWEIAERQQPRRGARGQRLPEAAE
jgi:DNA-binding IclR family transcriptional regulator